MRQFLVSTSIDSSKKLMGAFWNVTWSQQPPDELIDFDIVLPSRSGLSRGFDEFKPAFVILTLQAEKLQEEANCNKVTVLYAPVNVALSLEAVAHPRSFSQRPEKRKPVPKAP